MLPLSLAIVFITRPGLSLAEQVESALIWTVRRSLYWQVFNCVDRELRRKDYKIVPDLSSN